MNSKRVFYGLIVVLVLTIVGGGAMLYEGDTMLAKQNDKLTKLKLESASLDQVQASLINAKKDIVQYSAIESIAKTVVPQEKDQARTIREIVKLAAESKISIASITFPNSTLGNAPTAGAGAAQAAPTSVTQTKKVEGINNVEQLEITVSSETSKPIPYSSFIRFLEKLEQNRRTSQVATINIQPVPENRNLVTFTLILNVYIKKAS